MERTIEKTIQIRGTNGGKIEQVYTKLVNGDRDIELSIIISGGDEGYEIRRRRFEKMFPLVEASKLSMNDKFMGHIPKTQAQRSLKKAIIQLIKEGCSDFRMMAIEPSEDKNTHLFFEAGNCPAVGHSANWWEGRAKRLIPAKNSRLGTQKQYNAFLACFLKFLTEDRFCPIEEAWRKVCDDYFEFGKDDKAVQTKHGLYITGSEKFGNWYNLSNTSKFIRENESFGFMIAGRSRIYRRDPLAYREEILDLNKNLIYAVGWIVIDP